MTSARISVRQNQIIDELKSRILRGEFPPGGRLPTLTGLGRSTGACRVTVQRAIDRLRREGFIETLGRRGTFVVDHPPHLSHFGLLLPFCPPAGLNNNYFRSWELEVQRFARAEAANGDSGRTFSVYYEVGGPAALESQRELVDAVREHKLAGLIFVSDSNSFRDTPVLDDPTLPRVTTEPLAIPGGYSVRMVPYIDRALDYLSARGRRSVAFILHTWQEAPVGTAALVQSARSRGFTTHDHWVQGMDLCSPTWAANIARLLLHPSNSVRPDAIIIFDDNLAPAAVEGMLSIGVRIPDDVEVVAHGIFPYLTPTAVPVKRIGYSVRELLHLCVSIIERRRQGESVPKTTDLNCYLDDEIDAATMA